jgi:hypothetical protein
LKQVFQYSLILYLVFLYISCTKKTNKIQSSNHNNPYLGDTSIHFISQYGKIIEDSSTFKLLRCGLYINQFNEIAYKSHAATDGNIFYPEIGYTYTPIYLTTIYNANKKDIFGTNEAKMNTLIDTASFIKIGYEYFKDKNHIYYFFPMSDGGYFSLVNNVNYNTFVNLDSSLYAKDKNNCFYRNRKIKGADSKTFNVINTDEHSNIAFDKNNFYKGDDKLTKSEIKELELDSVRKTVHGY